VVKDVAMDVGKSFVDTIGKGVKDFASDMIGKGGKIVGDLIKNPLDALKDIGKKLIPPQFQMFMAMGKTLMQAATQILQKFMEKLNININVNVNVGGAQGAQGAQGGTVQAGPFTVGGSQTAGNSPQIMGHEAAAEAVLSHKAESEQSLKLNDQQMKNVPTPPTKGSSESSSAGETKSSGGASSSSGSKAEFNNLRDLMKTDPKAFAEKFDKMSEGEKTAFQQNMQEMNRMFTMLSQMLQMQHDTSKSIINNMRV
jgi:hypothetical protein